MPAHSSYDYAIIRVIPRVERGECINVGVILFCRTLGFLDASIQVDDARLLALAPDLDLLEIRRQLEAMTQVCAGRGQAGALGQLSQSERFHWLVAPRSTVIQTSPVHCGLSCNPAATLRRLLATLVACPAREKEVPGG
ncbi:MAG TPA: DUF3037 domain-containing protein [Ktedonobacteraceae bacterium]|jgi:hypothetical protein